MLCYGAIGSVEADHVSLSMMQSSGELNALHYFATNGAHQTPRAKLPSEPSWDRYATLNTFGSSFSGRTPSKVFCMPDLTTGHI